MLGRTGHGRIKGEELVSGPLCVRVRGERGGQKRERERERERERDRERDRGRAGQGVREREIKGREGRENGE